MTDWQSLTDIDVLMRELWKREGYRAELRERRSPDYKGKRGQAFPYWVVVDRDGNEMDENGSSDADGAWKAFMWHTYPFGRSIHGLLKRWDGGGSVVIESAGHDNQWVVAVRDIQYPTQLLFCEITSLDRLHFTLMRARCAYLDHAAQVRP